MRNLRRSCVIALAVACVLLTASALLTACSDDPTSDVPAPTPDPIEVSVEGAASDTSGAAVAGAAVAVYPCGSDSTLDETTTGEDGSYTLSFTAQEDEAPDALRLTFSAEGYAPEEATIDFAASITYNAELTPEAGDDDGEDPDPTEATASGSVVGAGSDDPIEGATLTGTAGDAELFTTTTAADGTYEAAFTVADEPGEITVTATAEGYEDAEQTVAFAEAVTADFALDAVDSFTEASISGTVTDGSNDDPIEGATITGSADGNELFTTATTADGTYEATFTVADEPGEIMLTASADGFEDDEQSVTFAEEMTADFFLEPVDTSTEATISGVVTDGETGDAVEAFTVKGEAQGTELFSATTAADGSYAASFTVVDEPSEITVTATAEGFEDLEQIVSFAEEMTADFQLEPVDTTTEASISGTVTDKDTGDPIEGATITGEAGGEELFSTTTGSDGSYEATFTVEDEPNEITLTATADDYEQGQQTVAFAVEMTADLQLTRVLDEFTITATVVNADGEPVEGITVTSDELDLAGTTGPGGQVTFTYTEVPGLPEITLTHTDPGGLYEDASVSISSNADVTYTVTLEDVTMGATASGTVTDDEGTPIEGATVTFAESELGIDASTTTGTDGAYTLSLGEVGRRHLGAFEMEATATAETYEEATAAPTLEETIPQDFTLESLIQEHEISFTLEPRDVMGGSANIGEFYAQIEGGEQQAFPVTEGSSTITLIYEGINPDDAQIEITTDKGGGLYSQVLMIREANQPGPIIGHTNIANNTIERGWTHGDPYEKTTLAAGQVNGIHDGLHALVAQYEHETNAGTFNINEEEIVDIMYEERTLNIAFGYGVRDGIDKMRYLIWEYAYQDPDYKINEEVIETAVSAAQKHGEIMPYDYEINMIQTPEDLQPFENEYNQNTFKVRHEFRSTPRNGTGRLDFDNYQFQSPNTSISSAGTSESTYMREIAEGGAGFDNLPITGETPSGIQYNSFAKTQIRTKLLLNDGTTVNR